VMIRLLLSYELAMTRNINWDPSLSTGTYPHSSTYVELNIIGLMLRVH